MEPRQTLADALLDVGKRAFDPATGPTSSDVALKEFNALVDGNASWDLLPALNALIKPNVAPPWLQPQLMRILTHIPLRTDGVRGTLEFIFSVHPSSRLKASEEAALHKTGANITQEALAVATRIIASPPATVVPTVWFAGIAPQLHRLLDGQDGPELARVAAQLVMIGILGKKQFGAPENLLYKGDRDSTRQKWTYKDSNLDGVDIIRIEDFDDTGVHQLNWDEIQQKSSAFVSLVSTSCTADEMSSFAMDLLGRWMADLSASASSQSKIKLELTEPEDKNPQIDNLCEVAVLQKMLEQIPEKLVSRIEQVLELVCQVLDPETLQTQSDDIIAVALSLLNLVITSPTFKRSNLKPRGLHVLETSLEKLGSGNHQTVSPTARNLALLLQYREAAEGEDEKDVFVPNQKQIEDRATYKLAISYITQPDNPPPVRSEGLNLISGLILANSTALDVQAVLVLLSSLIQDAEDYINLRVIKVFTQMANKHPNVTTREILDHYLDAKENSTTDTRLRFGEALLQVVERLGETFAGDIARQATETLLSIAGRRGYRPQTEAKQAREARRLEMRKKQAEDAWDGTVPDLGDEITEEDQATNDILTQIVEGWGSRRGSEDLRMRSSALSILGGALGTNVSGVGADLVSASVDLSVNILTLEPEPEKGILRRAAVLLIMSFVKALDDARQTGRSIGFGLTDSSRDDIMRVLKYIVITDNDGLVQQHAKDVIESLDSWQMATLLPVGREQSAGSSIGGLTNLNLGQNFSAPSIGQQRPRIEEIE
ncbi:hypothetical protein ACHAQH_001896 [Verticillium albo-atrum]